MENRFAVIGDPISHSLSPLIHKLFAEQTGVLLGYEKIRVKSAQFEQAVVDFFAQGGKGLNVTLPFKQQAFQMGVVCTPRCQQAKAANTLWFNKGVLHADTTDGVGLIKDLSNYIALKEKKVLILGAGGAARGIINSLISANIADLTIANRTDVRVKALQVDFPQIRYSSLLNLDSNFDLVINATSAGLIDQNFFMLPFELKPTTFCYDLIYNLQKDTPFIKLAKTQGCVATDGLGMLIEQAAESFAIWHGVRPDTSDIIRIYKNR